VSSVQLPSFKLVMVRRSAQLRGATIVGCRSSALEVTT
jgi:hypothetical protein